jgi:hypothetical protein
MLSYEAVHLHVQASYTPSLLHLPSFLPLLRSMTFRHPSTLLASVTPPSYYSLPKLTTHRL